MTRRSTHARPSTQGGRAAALVNLMAPEEEPPAPEVEETPEPAASSGREARWDGDTRYLVVADAFVAVDGDLYRSADKGTVLLLDPKTAARGVDSGALKKV